MNQRKGRTIINPFPKEKEAFGTEDFKYPLEENLETEEDSIFKVLYATK